MGALPSPAAVSRDPSELPRDLSQAEVFDRIREHLGTVVNCELQLMCIESNAAGRHDPLANLAMRYTNPDGRVFQFRVLVRSILASEIE